MAEARARNRDEALGAMAHKLSSLQVELWHAKEAVEVLTARFGAEGSEVLGAVGLAIRDAWGGVVNARIKLHSLLPKPPAQPDQVAPIDHR